MTVISAKTDRSHEPSQEHRRSPHHINAEDVACDQCEGRKLKACKSCMTCLTSYCETHVRGHYTKKELQGHLLVEVETPVAGPGTDHYLHLQSIHGKRVLLEEEKPINHSPQRFDKYKCILTTEGFSSGRHYWEVTVNREFIIGVTRESARRKGRFSFSPARGYWCLHRFRQSFKALEEPSRCLPIDAVPRVMGVCTDVDEKWVIFFNFETKENIYTFSQMDFVNGENICPVFITMEKSVLKKKTAGLFVKVQPAPPAASRG